MPSTIRAGFQNVGEVRRDLDSVQLGLGRSLTEVLREESGPLAQLTRQLTPRGPGPQSPRDNLPHVADTIIGNATATTLTIQSTHPASGWLEWGGTIEPRRGQRITIRGHGMAHRAGELKLDELAASLIRRIDALLRQHGL